VKRLFLFLLLVLFATNCSGYITYTYTHRPENIGVCYTIPVFIDKNFGNADKVEIYNAVQSVNYSLNGYIKLDIQQTSFDMEPSILQKVIQDDNGIIILKIESDNPIIPNPDPERITAAFTDPSKHFIYLIEDRLRSSESRFVDATRHELMHGLYADHVNDHPSMMNNPYVKEYAKCVDYYTMIQVAKHYNLNPSLLNYCTYDN
jgi:hypothetical protein